MPTILTTVSQQELRSQTLCRRARVASNGAPSRRPKGPLISPGRRRQKPTFAPVGSPRSGRTFGRAVMQGDSLHVLVVEGRWWWREAMLRVLERRGPEFVPHAAAGADRVRQLVDEVRPDVAIVDLDDEDAAAVLGDLRDRDIPCVALSSGASREHVGAALRSAASYAVKSEIEPDRLCQLVSIAAAGDALLVQAHRRVLEKLVQIDGDSPAARFDLTPREHQVLDLIARGRTNAEIAGTLHLAPSSVKKVVSRCLTRLGVRNRVEAAVVARREGLLLCESEDDGSGFADGSLRAATG
jgi:DNA-binding NarL/FixJ family response regulator